MSMRFSVVHMAWGALLKRLQRKTTRSHFFYYDKCGNGKMYPFANVFFFAIWGGKLFYRFLTYKLQVFIFASSNGKKLQIEIFCHFNYCHNRRNALAKTWPVISHSLKIWTYERLYITAWIFFFARQAHPLTCDLQQDHRKPCIRVRWVVEFVTALQIYSM